MYKIDTRDSFFFFEGACLKGNKTDGYSGVMVKIMLKTQKRIELDSKCLASSISLHSQCLQVDIIFLGYQ